MAVIQISKIQVRSGLYEDLPALDTGEFGWCVDTQRLFIGRGTLQEGAPITGVTEILTEYSAGAIGVSIEALNSNVANINTYIASVSSLLSNATPTTVQILDNQSSIVNIANVSITSLTSRIINYNITRGAASRIGTISVTNYTPDPVFSDEYTETQSTGVTLYFTGNVITNAAVLGYTTTSTGAGATFTYSYTDLRTII